MRDAGGAVDHQRLAAEVLGIRGAPPDLARKLVAQALVLEDRRDAWRSVGERICRDAPVTPGVYILKDDSDRPVYVGKAINVRRRLRAHFAERRWRATKADFARVASAEWIEVGSDLEALLREASLIAELAPVVNVQRETWADRAIPPALVRDTIVIVPSVEDDSAELVAARADGPWQIQRTRRNGADLAVHGQRLWRFFHGTSHRSHPSHSAARTPHLAPIVFSWLAGRGTTATRLDVRSLRDARDLRTRLAWLLKDERLFHERLEQC
ncbi:MAG TPA: nucleotide excision repair endonuclease [Vicinamibacterales bacterium]|nr:nucleotide excision repair endonuclease [Vicinamibacterales bacterium]